jgi:hypothetical protein
MKTLIYAIAVAIPFAPLAQEQRPHHHHPSPEAIAACESKESGASCSFMSHNGRSVEGTCFTPASDKPLACRPAGAPAESKPESAQ